LTRNDPRLDKRQNPLTKGIEKYAQALKPFPLRFREQVNDYIRSEMHTFEIPRRPQILTQQEAVTGLSYMTDSYEPLPKNTSPGWPYINTRPKGEVGKAYLFDINGQIKSQELQNKLNERLDRAKRGERCESIWLDCLKDERRPAGKATRVFTIGPVDYSLMSRMYCLDYTEAIKASRRTSFCKLGIDCQSLEWTQLYTYLTEFSEYMVAGDFSRFDGTVHAEMIEDYYNDVDYFYQTFGDWEPEDKKVRDVLADETCHTVQLAKDEFYMTHCGNTSGNPATTPLNSSTNFRYMALAWLILAESQDFVYRTMTAFAKNVRLACYGDDNIISIKKEVIEWFNQETISQALEEYGIVYTNAEKTGVTKYQTIDECTFLKQGFANHESIANIKVPYGRKHDDGTPELDENCSRPRRAFTGQLQRLLTICVFLRKAVF